jgi:1-deoxy-D-xylulose-5-phosphate reductoisomerase
VKRLAILGSTGSIGRQTLEVVRCFKDRFDIVALAAGKNVDLLAEQAAEFEPQFVSSLGATELDLPSTRYGRALPLSPEEMAAHPDVDLVVVATSGKAGLEPTLSALRAGKQIALANKEVLVMAGEIVMAQARQQEVEILPLDSEHSALWQCLRGEQREDISRIILTASGGPFRNYSADQLAAVTPDQALNHPTWQMGTKVTIDSATLMNKGMEIIEARWLFNVPVNRIKVIVHPESIVHSFVEFGDGSIKAQLSWPDMRLPIQHALCYPDRPDSGQFPKLDWDEMASLDFGPPDLTRFPCLRLALEAIAKGGTYPAVLCAADEVAVQRFLGHEIGFMDIPRLVEDALGQHQGVSEPSLEDILVADGWAREYTENRRLGSES